MTWLPAVAARLALKLQCSRRDRPFAVHLIKSHIYIENERRQTAAAATTGGEGGGAQTFILARVGMRMNTSHARCAISAKRLQRQGDPLLVSGCTSEWLPPHFYERLLDRAGDKERHRTML